jgi:metal-responsive CopG/Arc/MetJ family transcriptional regulator
MTSFSNTINKVKVTITLNRNITNTLDEFARKKEIPRSQAIEGILKDWISNSRKKSIENEIKNYYCSLSEEEKEEDKLWLKIAEKSAEGLWGD